MQVIRFYDPQGPFGALSTWYPYPLMIDGQRWDCAAHYLKKKRVDVIFTQLNWEQQVENIVRKALVAKLEQQPGLKQLLDSTGQMVLLQFPPGVDLPIVDSFHETMLEAFFAPYKPEVQENSTDDLMIEEEIENEQPVDEEEIEHEQLVVEEEIENEQPVAEEEQTTESRGIGLEERCISEIYHELRSAEHLIYFSDAIGLDAFDFGSWATESPFQATASASNLPEVPEMESFQRLANSLRRHQLFLNDQIGLQDYVDHFACNSNKHLILKNQAYIYALQRAQHQLEKGEIYWSQDRKLLLHAYFAQPILREIARKEPELLYRVPIEKMISEFLCWRVSAEEIKRVQRRLLIRSLGKQELLYRFGQLLSTGTTEHAAYVKVYQIWRNQRKIDLNEMETWSSTDYDEYQKSLFEQESLAIDSVVEHHVFAKSCEEWISFLMNREIRWHEIAVHYLETTFQIELNHALTDPMSLVDSETFVIRRWVTIQELLEKLRMDANRGFFNKEEFIANFQAPVREFVNHARALKEWNQLFLVAPELFMRADWWQAGPFPWRYYKEEIREQTMKRFERNHAETIAT